MTYEEAMVIVDAGGFVSRESIWLPRAAGFSWGTWISRERRWAKDDHRRERERVWTEENPVAPTEPTGPYCRAAHTLCETFFDYEGSEETWKATDWIDVTDRFERGSPRGYLEYMGYTQLPQSLDSTPKPGDKGSDD